MLLNRYIQSQQDKICALALHNLFDTDVCVDGVFQPCPCDPLCTNHCACVGLAPPVIKRKVTAKSSLIFVNTLTASAASCTRSVGETRPCIFQDSHLFLEMPSDDSCSCRCTCEFFTHVVVHLLIVLHKKPYALCPLNFKVHGS